MAVAVPTVLPPGSGVVERTATDGAEWRRWSAAARGGGLLGRLGASSWDPLHRPMEPVRFALRVSGVRRHGIAYAAARRSTA